MAAQAALTNELLSLIVRKLAPGADAPGAIPPLGLDYLADWLELRLLAAKESKEK